MYLGGNLPYTTTLQRRLLFPSEAFAHERELSHTAPIGQGGTLDVPYQDPGASALHTAHPTAHCTNPTCAYLTYLTSHC